MSSAGALTIGKPLRICTVRKCCLKLSGQNFWPTQNDWLIQYLVFAEGIFSLSSSCWEEPQPVIAMDRTHENDRDSPIGGTSRSLVRVRPKARDIQNLGVFFSTFSLGFQGYQYPIGVYKPSSLQGHSPRRLTALICTLARREIPEEGFPWTSAPRQLGLP